MKTLNEHLQSYDVDYYDINKATRPFLDVKVIKKHRPDIGAGGFAKPWPGQHRHVWIWFELENGYGVGLNENPGKGWSFPAMKVRK